MTRELIVKEETRVELLGKKMSELVELAESVDIKLDKKGSKIVAVDKLVAQWPNDVVEDKVEDVVLTTPEVGTSRLVEASELVGATIIENATEVVAEVERQVVEGLLVDNGALEGLAITREEVLKRAPSSGSTKSYIGLSDKYLHVNTSRVIDDLLEHGWRPIAARETKNTAAARVGCNKHMIVLANISSEFAFPEGYVTIIITNAHDGSHSLQIRVGIYRKVCSNGLITGRDIIEPIRITHKEYNAAKVLEVAKLVQMQAANVKMMIERLQNITVTDNMKYRFATAALSFKFSEEQLKNIEVDIDELVAPTRTEDEANSAWNLLNVIQEKAMKGITYRSSKLNKKGQLIVSTRTTKVLRRIDTIIELNEQLWSLTGMLTA